MAKDEIIQISKNEEKPEDGFSVTQTDISHQMQKAYLDYAMSVIVSRALPDVRDGLKPVHRRIIYAMQDQGVTHTSKFQKSASVVGEVMKNYHPHGNEAIYDSLVRMGQDFSLRYPLIIPQGNFGSIDGDPAAAMRYTECKMSKISDELYKDIDKDTVDFELNDLQNYEPLYLPSLLPNLLLNGSAGIAVGMATNIPPHNLNEVVDAILYMIEKTDKLSKEIYEKEIDVINQKQIIKVIKTEFASEATSYDLINYIQGPDFPTGAIIYDQKEIIHMYATGKGKVVTRAKMDIEEMANGKTKIIVTEIPYQIQKSTLLTRIAELVKIKKIDGIVDLRDESSRNEIRIMIELKRGAIAKKVQNSLYKYTQLQSTFNTNMVALIDNEPKLMPLKMILEEFIKHRQQVVVRRTIFLLKKAKAREHILLGLKIALDNLDEVIKLIRASKDADAAKSSLMKRFGFTEIQAQAILDMQLRRLAALERQKIEDELKEIINTIKEFEGILISGEKIMNIIKQELKELKEKFGDERKTKVVKGRVGEISDEDIVVNEKCIITLSEGGYIKRMKEGAYHIQGRGGTGVSGGELKDEDQITTIKTCDTHDWALIFTNSGKVYKMRVWEIPEYARKAKGTPIINFLSVSQEETVQALLTIPPEQLEEKAGYILLVTKTGKIKKTELGQFENIRTSGIISINLTDGDNLVFADISSGKNEILLVTLYGQSIRFKEEDVRPMGRSASGVTGIKLIHKDDKVIGAITVPKDNKDKYLLTVSQDGYGKKTPLDEYRLQSRGGSGIFTYKISDKTGLLVSARLMDGKIDADMLVVTEQGMVIRMDTTQIPNLGRYTIGVRLIKLKEKDKVTSVAIVEKVLEDLTNPSSEDTHEE